MAENGLLSNQPLLLVDDEQQFEQQRRSRTALAGLTERILAIDRQLA